MRIQLRRRGRVREHLGTTVEWYDFFLYGVASAVVLPRVFFPAVLLAGALRHRPRLGDWHGLLAEIAAPTPD